MNIMFIENDYTSRPQRLKSNVFLKNLTFMASIRIKGQNGYFTL